MEQALIPVGSHFKNWWSWCQRASGVAYQRFLKAHMSERESILPTETMPVAWDQIDSWMRPKLLEAIPGVVREWVGMRARQGRLDGTHVIIFWVVKQFGPGSVEEQVAINSNILNPSVCSNPRAAQIELMKWKENIRRLAELSISPPALLLTYRAMESIFNVVFDKAEPQLNARWISLKNELGLPHHITQQAFERVAAFADSELGALVLSGHSSLNTGLPLTENQKARHNQIKDTEKKRAAAAKVQPAPKVTKPPLVKAPPTVAAGFNKSATTSMWAAPCTSWTTKGQCWRGISCNFAHAGFPISEQRCVTCGKPDHSCKQCTSSGGGADPNHDAAWAEYRKRKETNVLSIGKGKAKDTGGKGKGQTPEGKGRGKGKGKGKDKGKGKGKGTGKGRGRGRNKG